MMQIVEFFAECKKAFSWKAYSLLSIIASCSPDFHTHSHFTKRKLQINILRDRED
jgi:hypothetical protein